MGKKIILGLFLLIILVPIVSHLHFRLKSKEKFKLEWASLDKTNQSFQWVFKQSFENEEGDELVYINLESDSLYSDNIGESLIKELKDNSSIIIESSILNSSEPMLEFLSATLGLQSEKWHARYYASIDSVNNQRYSAELKVLARDYKSIYDQEFPYSSEPALILYRGDQDIVIMHSDMLTGGLPTLLNRASVPGINSTAKLTESSWFEMNQFDSLKSDILIELNLPLSQKGDSIIQSLGLSPTVPVYTRSKTLKLAYIGVDKHAVSPYTRAFRFSGEEFFNNLIRDTKDQYLPEYSFWNVYKPVLTFILTSFSDQKFEASDLDANLSFDLESDVQLDSTDIDIDSNSEKKLEAHKTNQWYVVIASFSKASNAKRFSNETGFQYEAAPGLNFQRIIGFRSSSLLEAQKAQESLYARYPDAWLAYW